MVDTPTFCEKHGRHHYGCPCPECDPEYFEAAKLRVAARVAEKRSPAKPPPPPELTPEVLEALEIATRIHMPPWRRKNRISQDSERVTKAREVARSWLREARAAMEGRDGG